MFAAGLQLIAVIAAWHRRRQSVLLLSQLSDAALRDIGVSRIDIPQVVNAAMDAARESRPQAIRRQHRAQLRNARRLHVR